MVKVILFDVYGTLLDVHSIKMVLEKYLPGNGDESSRLLREKQIEYTRLYSLRPPQIPYESFMSLTRAALEYTIQFIGKNVQDVPVDEIMSRYQKLEKFPEVSEVLDYIRSNSYSIAVLSNGNSEMLREVLNNSGLQDKIEVYLSASSVLSFKTDERVYKIASEFFKCNSDECLLVSANYWDIIGAGWNGLKTFWVNRSSSPKDPIGYAPDFEGKSLEDLKRIL